jgi:rhodanese-related sulfurtransferase
MIKDSRIHAYPAADSGKAQEHFLAKLSLECDPSDLNHDLKLKVPGLVVLDGRKAASYEDCHIPGALNLYHALINVQSTKDWSKENLYVCYCTGVGCNASTKAALNLAGLGFQVKELIGGLTEWEREGYPVAKGKAAGVFPA